MQDQDKSKDQLIIELEALRQRVSELEKGRVQQKPGEYAADSRHYFSTILQSMPDGFVVIDCNRGITEANEAYCRMSGYLRAELLSLNVSDIDAVEEPPVAETRKRRIIGEGSATFETCHRRKDGSVFDVEVSATYLGMADGRTVCLCRDITGRKEAEAALAKSEQRFSLAMEATKARLWDWDLLTDDVYYSPGYLAILGYASGEVPADVHTWADRIHPEDKNAAFKANMDCIENRCDDFEVEFRMQARNGEWRWIMGRGKAAGRDENGRAVRMVGIHTDITERKRRRHCDKASGTTGKSSTPPMMLFSSMTPTREPFST
jgi:PAS domain S-box-containing protein